VLLGRREAGLAEAFADQLVRVEIHLPVMGVVTERLHGQYRAREVELQDIHLRGGRRDHVRDSGEPVFKHPDGRVVISLVTELRQKIKRR
jgi:hypothetical protein